MAKGFGVAALVVGILSIYVPLVTIYVIWLALVLATVAGLLGDKVFPLATFATCLINILFLSPVTLAGLAAEREAGGSAHLVITIILFIAPVAALIIGAVKSKKKAVQG